MGAATSWGGGHVSCRDVVQVSPAAAVVDADAAEQWVVNSACQTARQECGTIMVLGIRRYGRPHC